MSTIPSYHPIPSILRSELQNVQSPFQLNYLYMFDRLRLIHTGPWILYIPTLQSIEGTKLKCETFATAVHDTCGTHRSQSFLQISCGFGEWMDIG